MALISAFLLLAAASWRGAPSPVLRQDAPTAPADRPIVAEKKWALCVGAGAYKDLSPLKYAPSDAKAFASVLKEKYGFEPSTVGLIADGEAKAPSSANILGELDRLLADKRLDRGDLFVFYFSGHGVGKPSGDYLMPTDVPEKEAEKAAIPVKTLIERFVKAGLKNVLVVADACRSGAQNPFGRELQELGRKSNIAVLLGCAPGQRSYEYPQLEKGVFTHFLVKSMADASLADKSSGALWASAVAKKVQGQVKEYTEADYGEDAQTPAVWTEPSQDVLLAAYPPTSEESKMALEALDVQFKEGKFDPQRYGRYLSTMGQALSERKRKREAIEVLKTLDGLGLATWRDLSTLAFALRDEERDNEIGSLVARAIREPEPTDLSEFVVVQGLPGYVGAERYRRAMERITRPETYGFQGAMLLSILSRQRLLASDARVARDLAPFVPLFPKESFEGRYIAANIALGQNRFAEAITLAEAAGAMPGREDHRDELRQIRFRAADGLKDDPKIEAIIAEGEADEEDAFPWVTERFKRMKARKDPALLQAAKEFAAKTDSDRRLTEMLVVLGPNAGELLPDAQRLAALHPYSWQAPVNVWLAQAAHFHFSAVVALPDEAIKYAPDRADLVRWAMNRYDDLLESAVESRVEGVDGWTAANARRGLALRYADNWDDVKDSPMALMGFSRILMRGPEALRGAYFTRMFLWPYAQKQDYVGQELRSVCLYLAINGGDEEMAKEVFARLEKDGELSPRAVVRYTVFSALHNDGEEVERAIGLWPKTGRGEPDKVIQAYFAASRGLIAAKAGDKAKAKALIDSIEAADSAAAMLALHTRYEIADGGSISAEWVKFLMEPMTDFTDLRVAGLARAIEGYAKLGVKAKTEVTSLSSMMIDYPAHPWVRPIGFAGKKGIETYGGITRWKGRFANGPEGQPCTMTLAIRRDGKVIGAFTFGGNPADDANRWSLEGEVDEFGNLIADVGQNAKQGDEKWVGSVVMKLPPTGFQKEPGRAETEVRMIMLQAPHQGFGFDLTCFESKTLAEAESGGQPSDPPPMRSARG